jgi:hypothetical protein
MSWKKNASIVARMISVGTAVSNIAPLVGIRVSGGLA